MDPHNHSNGDSEQTASPLTRRPVQHPGALLELREALQESSMSEETVQRVRALSPLALIKSVAFVEPHDAYTARQIFSQFLEKAPEDLRAEIHEALFLALRDPESDVRRVAIEEIYKIIQANPNALPIESYLEGYISIAELVGDGDLSTFNKAINITSQQDIDKHPRLLTGLARPFGAPSPSGKINAFEVVVNLSCRGESYFQQCSNAGYIESLVSEVIDCPDFLFELNILELVKKLALTPYGLDYIVNRRLLEKLSDRIQLQNKHPMRTVILPGYLKFFGAIAHVDPKGAFFNYPPVWEHLVEFIYEGQRALLSVSLDTLGRLGSTIEGKLCLAEQGAKYTSLVVKVGDYIRDSYVDIKTRALYCVADLIGFEKDPKVEPGAVNQRVTLMTREWFRSIADHPMDMLYGVCKNPFLDIKLAGFELLDAVSQHAWGQEMVAATPGFVEYLLDRSAEHTKDSQEVKFLIVKRLSRSASFDPTVALKMATYVEQGVFYAETPLQVAMEEGN